MRDKDTILLEGVYDSIFHENIDFGSSSFERLYQELTSRGYTFSEAYDDNAKPHPDSIRHLTTSYPTFTNPDGIKLGISNSPLFTDPNRGGVWRGPSPLRDTGKLTLEVILTPPNLRGRGLASKALKDVMDAADAANVTLVAEPARMKPFVAKGQKGLTTSQLKKWYKKHGWDSPEEHSGYLVTKSPKRSD